jgi:hypothetical protein
VLALILRAVLAIDPSVMSLVDEAGREAVSSSWTTVDTEDNFIDQSEITFDREHIAWMSCGPPQLLSLARGVLQQATCQLGTLAPVCSIF